jgi:nucleotide-binding universal stress UspA family protein
MTAIVVGTDGSEGGMAAVVKAGRLAAATGGRVVVVSAYGSAPPVTAMAPEASFMAGPGADRATDVLARAARQLDAEGVANDTRAVMGGAADALCEVAAIENADTIVVGSRGMRGVTRLLGSVPNAVAHRSPCDVLVVRTD